MVEDYIYMGVLFTFSVASAMAGMTNWELARVLIKKLSTSQINSNMFVLPPILMLNFRMRSPC